MRVGIGGGEAVPAGEHRPLVVIAQRQHGLRPAIVSLEDASAQCVGRGNVPAGTPRTLSREAWQGYNTGRECRKVQYELEGTWHMLPVVCAAGERDVLREISGGDDYSKRGTQKP